MAGGVDFLKLDHPPHPDVPVVGSVAFNISCDEAVAVTTVTVDCDSATELGLRYSLPLIPSATSRSHAKRAQFICSDPSDAAPPTAAQPAQHVPLLLVRNKQHYTNQMVLVTTANKGGHLHP